MPSLLNTIKEVPFADPDFEISAFFDMTPDLVCIAGKDGFFRRVNNAVIQKLGYSEKELMSRPIASFIHPDDRKFTQEERNQLLEGKVLLNLENRYMTKRGGFIWLEWTSVYFPEKEVVFAVAKDVSKRKRAEKEIEEKFAKFKSLANHFKTSIEEDRKYLAVEIHEELAQLASVVKMDIEWVLSEMQGLKESSRKRIEHSSAICNLLINTMRRISFSLCPNMLEEFGLEDSLEWQCQEFTALTGIKCSFESAYTDGRLTPEIKTDFFRISQEALTNIMYHSEATQVKILLREVGDLVSLCVMDNGKGFDIVQQKKSPGLVAMRERASSINGHLIVESKIGKGTKVCFEVILPA